MTRSSSSIFLASALAVSAGCSMGASPAGGHDVTCKSTSNCPAGQTCDPTYHLCVVADGGAAGMDGGSAVADAGTCAIGGELFAAFAYNPNDPCQTCQPAVSTTAFTNLPAGVPLDGGCQAGEVCENGQCTRGCFFPPAVFVAEGGLEAANPCHLCAPDRSTTAWTDLTGAPADGGCGAGEVCNAGTCAAGCVIAGAFVPPDAASPANACAACIPETSTAGYSPVSGTACDGGAVCNLGACQAGCFIDGGFVSPNTLAADPCEGACFPSTNLFGWSFASDYGPCDGGICQHGVCTPGCFIGNVPYPEGTAEPGDSCQTCRPASSTSNWTELNGGVCNSSGGNYCQGGQCVLGCVIDGGFVPNNTQAGGACLTCNPTFLATDWSPLAGQAPCDGGFCAEPADCVPECSTDAGYVMADVLNAADPNQCCVPSTNKYGWTDGFTVHSGPATGLQPSGIAAGKLYGTGNDDLAVANTHDDTISVFKNQGDGTFGAAKTLSLASGSGPVAVTIGDLGNGNPDIAVASSLTSTVTVFLNDGQGNFSDGGTYSVGVNPKDIAVADFQHQGSADLAVAYSVSGKIGVLLNKADGSATFQAQSTYSAGASPFALAVGDFNGDTHPDIAVANVTGAVVLVNTASPSPPVWGNAFSTWATVSVASPQSIAAVDIDRDGKIDLVVTDASGNVDVFRNTSTGTNLAAAVTTSLGGTVLPSKVVAGDFNGDSKPDIAVVDNNSSTVYVLINESTPGSVSFAAPATYHVGQSPVSLATGLFNSDTLPDLAVVNSVGSPPFLSILLGNCP